MASLALRPLHGLTAWLAAGVLACASSPTPESPPAQAAAASRTGAPPADAVAPSAPDLPEDHPYADLRAQIERQRREGTTGDASLDPLREELSRQLEQQIEARKWTDPSSTSADGVPGDPELGRISAEIAEETRRREEQLREIQDQAHQDSFEGLAAAPLHQCVTSSEHIAGIQGDFVHWRKLRRDDFRAEEMQDFKPVVRTGRSFVPGAHVGLAIICVAGIQVVELGPDSYEARVTRLRYVALLDRGLSWWNEEGDHVSEEWTLRHEQVHFDLAEVEARRLNGERIQVMETIRGRGGTAVDAVSELQERWANHMMGVRAKFLDLERAYDRETLHGNDLDRQTEWFSRAKRGLVESRPATGG